MYSKIIFHTTTHPIKHKGDPTEYVGYFNFTLNVAFHIFKECLKNKIKNWLWMKNYKMKLWAIDDNELNYDIYIESIDETDKLNK